MISEERLRVEYSNWGKLVNPNIAFTGTLETRMRTSNGVYRIDESVYSKTMWKLGNKATKTLSPARKKQGKFLPWFGVIEGNTDSDRNGFPRAHVHMSFQFPPDVLLEDAKEILRSSWNRLDYTLPNIEVKAINRQFGWCWYLTKEANMYSGLRFDTNVKANNASGKFTLNHYDS